MKLNNKLYQSYAGLFLVIFIWGIFPMVVNEIQNYYSPTIRVCFSEFILIITYILLSLGKLKEYNINYIKVGIPTGIFLSLATILQKIGLLYTTPAKYAFLENLSCISVPVLMYILVKKKPGIFTLTACLTCLASAFLLNGVSFSDGAWGIGEILCAASGLLYGFNIAGISVYGKKLKTTLLLATQSAVSVIVSLALSLVLNFTKTLSADGTYKPIEQIVFSFKPELIIFIIIFTVISSAFCWIIRTNAMKYVSPTTIAILTPFSSIVTGIASVIMGTDRLSFNLVSGAILSVLALLLTSLDSILFKKPDISK